MTSEILLLPFAEKGVEKESRSGGKLSILVLLYNIEILLLHFTCHLHVVKPMRHQKVSGCKFTSML